MIRDFKQAWQAGDISALLGLLDPDATFVADGGGIVSAIRHPLEGADLISRFFVGLNRTAADQLDLLERMVNGQPGLVATQDGAVATVFAFEVTDDRISRIWAIRNPVKLGPWLAAAGQAD